MADTSRIVFPTSCWIIQVRTSSREDPALPKESLKPGGEAGDHHEIQRYKLCVQVADKVSFVGRWWSASCRGPLLTGSKWCSFRRSRTSERSSFWIVKQEKVSYWMCHSNWSFISHVQDWHYAGRGCSGIPGMKRETEMRASPYCKNNITLKFGDWFKVGQFKLFCLMWGVWRSREDPTGWCLLFTYFSSWDFNCLVHRKTVKHSLAYMR